MMGQRTRVRLHMGCGESLKSRWLETDVVSRHERELRNQRMKTSGEHVTRKRGRNGA